MSTPLAWLDFPRAPPVLIPTEDGLWTGKSNVSALQMTNASPAREALVWIVLKDFAVTEVYPEHTQLCPKRQPLLLLDLFTEEAMLILRRKIGQSIVFAGAIRVTILNIRGGQVKIGIEAPRSVPILRGELEALEPTGKQPAAPSSEAPTQTLSETPTC
jgi:carbon storage regulator